MAIDVMIGLPCEVKLALAGKDGSPETGGEALTALLIRSVYLEGALARGLTGKETLTVRRRFGGDPSRSETESVSIETLRAEGATLDRHAARCQACVLGLGRFGCFSRIGYPISAAAESWLMDRVQRAGAPGSDILVYAVEMGSLDPGPAARARTAGFLSLSQPITKEIRPATPALRGPIFSTRAGRPLHVSSDQLLTALFWSGALGTMSLFTLLTWLGALRIDGKEVETRADLEAVASLPIVERFRRVTVDVGGETVADPGVQQMRTHLVSMFCAWVTGVELLLSP